MSLWPKSLWGRTWASTVLLLSAAQILTMLLFAGLIIKPETERVAMIMAQNVAATSDTLAALPPAQRTAAIRRLAQSPYLTVWTGASPPDASGPPPRALERVFMNALIKAMGTKTDLYWRTDHSRKLWLHVALGGDPYWISVRAPPALGPTGMFMIAFVITASLAMIAAWGLSARILRPLDGLKSATETYRLAGGTAPLPEDGPTEIAAVSRSFNRMTQRLARADAERSLILAGISHDVRTPLAKLKLAFEMMHHEDASLRDSAQRQIDTIDRILSQFMTFARGFDAEPESRIDAEALLRDIAADYAGSDVHLADVAAIEIPCRPEALRRAVCNLVENALRYGRAPVELSLIGEAGMAVFTVHDRGDGIDEAQLATIREPFMRADSARKPAGDTDIAVSGTGLGLAIVDKVAQLHGGRLDLGNVPGGFTARLVVSL